MLKQRVFTAVLLLSVLLGVLFFLPPVGFGVAMLALILAAVWEWSRLNQWPRSAWLWALLAVFGCLLIGGQTLSSQSWLNRLQPWGLLLVVWTLLLAAMLWRKQGWWSRIPAFLRLLMGLFVLLGAWWALFEMRSHSISFLISAMALIWVADIGAYFAGRSMGGKLISRKLAPRLSPKKTWEGVLGGFVAMLLLSAAWLALESALAWQPSVFRLIYIKYGWLWGSLCYLLVLAYVVLGDLFESMMKRCAHVKDSGRLLPGHGGVLDRIDALLPTMPLLLFLL